MYSRFGTFLANCERERDHEDHKARTRSLFSYILQRKRRFTNPFYSPTSVRWREACERPVLMFLCGGLMRWMLWFVLRSDACPDAACAAPQRYMDPGQCNTVARPASQVVCPPHASALYHTVIV